LAGKIYEEQNKLTEALTEYQYVNDNYPEDSSVLNSIGRIYIKLKWFNRAELILTKSLEINSTNNQEAVILLSMNYYHKGNYNKALNLIDAYKLDKLENEELLLLKANIYYEQNDFSNAEKYYNSVIRINAKNPIPYLKLNEIYKKRNENDKAILLVENGYANTDKNLEIALLIIDYYLKNNNLYKVEKYLNEINDIYKNNERVIYYNAKYELIKLNYNRARELFEKVILLNENYLDAYYGLIEVYYAQKEFPKCLKVIDVVLSNNKNDAYTYFLKGKILKYLGLNNEAINELKKAIEIVPTADFYFEISDLYYKQKWYDEALSYIVKALELSSEIKYKKLYLKILIDTNKKEKLQEIISTILQEASTDSEILFLAAKYYIDINENKGIELLNNLVRDYPNYYKAIELLANIEMQNKNYKRAIELYNRLVINEINAALYNFNIGLCYYKLKDYKTSLKYFLEAEKLKLNTPDLFYNIGVIYKLLEEYELSIKYLKRTIELSPDDAETYLLLGNIYAYNARDYYLAKYYWNNYIRLRPDDPNNEKLREQMILFK
ncbi:MAG TPA: tetratricopeptide repeat protein, partial [bacterium]|nr:tetratricopeptide repeat protein [bacterium]